MDPLAQVALIGICSTFITVAGGVVVAVMNSRKERTGSAENAKEQVLLARLEFRDEQLAAVRGERDQYKRERDEALIMVDEIRRADVRRPTGE